ncbi:MAG: hypothetical protein ACTSUE_09055 [Promethearchaeota archaeon]
MGREYKQSKWEIGSAIAYAILGYFVGQYIVGFVLLFVEASVFVEHDWERYEYNNGLCQEDAYFKQVNKQMCDEATKYIRLGQWSIQFIHAYSNAPLCAGQHCVDFYHSVMNRGPVALLTLVAWLYSSGTLWKSVRKFLKNRSKKRAADILYNSERNIQTAQRVYEDDEYNYANTHEYYETKDLKREYNSPSFTISPQTGGMMSGLQQYDSVSEDTDSDSDSDSDSNSESESESESVSHF